jgi:hypothetical protein
MLTVISTMLMIEFEKITPLYEKKNLTNICKIVKIVFGWIGAGRQIFAISISDPNATDKMENIFFNLITKEPHFSLF